MHYTYILQSKKDKSYYIGFTSDLRKRFKQHNQHSSKYTSTKAPFKLVWYASFATKEKVMNFEKYLKSSSGFAFRNKRLH
jgi:putative endonuclease